MVNENALRIVAAHARLVLVILAFGVCLATAHPAHAQNPNQFGGQQRADAAHELIVLAVERAVASLPPTAGQSVTYEFDPASDAMRRSLSLGPTVLRSAQTIGAGTFSLRVAASYFDLSESFGPTRYVFDFAEPLPGDSVLSQAVAKLGLEARARVGLLNLSVGYGVTNRVEVTGNLPLSVVDASASQTFSTLTTELGQPASQAPLNGVQFFNGDVAGASRELDARFQSGRYTLRRETFSDLGFDFNDGTHLGVGRISLGAKGLIWSTPVLQVAAMTEVFLPSPSSNQFAGSDTFSILPRAIATVVLGDQLRLHSDVGYDYNIDEAPLRRFTWSVGGSLALQRASLDLGLGGSEYDARIQWTPTVVQGARTPSVPSSTGRALDDTAAGDSYVDLLLGIKFRLTDAWVVAGAVTVPVVREDFQPDALGTIALERYF